MMNKVFVITTGMILFLLLLLIIPHFYYLLTASVRSNNDFDEDINDAVKKLVDQTLRAHYGAYKRNEAKEIYTDEFQKRIEEEAVFTALREKGRFYWFADRSYMQSLRHIAKNDNEEKILHISVRVEEGLLFNTFTLIHQITIIGKEDGSYVIADIEYDT